MHESSLLRDQMEERRQDKHDQLHTRGHSSPIDAADTAKLFQARRLVLNHVSPQFSIGSTSLNQNRYSAGVDVMSDVYLQEVAGAALNRKDHVTIARDYMTVSIPVGGYSLNSRSYLISRPK